MMNKFVTNFNGNFKIYEFLNSNPLDYHTKVYLRDKSEASYWMANCEVSPKLTREARCAQGPGVTARGHM